MYADDDTDHAQDKDPNKLLEKIQHEADCSTAWVADNKLVCSGSKTKLLIVTTTAMRLSRLTGRQLAIQVGGKTVKESECERILGILANNKLTWHHHMFGDQTDPNKPIPGLISQLSRRVGMLARISSLVPYDRFKLLVNGLFMSKLLYCLPLFANIWGLKTTQEGETRNNSFTQSHLRSLQTLQNKILRLLSGLKYETPTVQLLEKTKMLSVNQLVAYTTMMIVFKVHDSSEPVYLAKRLKINAGGRININFNLSRAREGFMYRAAKSFSSLPTEIKTESKIRIFKTKLKEWIKSNIPAIPF